MKYVNTGIVFQEIPGEVTLSINISGCPCHCPGCHSEYLWDDVGQELDEKALDKLLKQYSADITCVSFMGGDGDPACVNRLAKHVHENHKPIKTAWWSGRMRLHTAIDLNNLDFLKLGPYLAHLGPLNKETTNQRLYKITNGKIGKDITYRFWKKKKTENDSGNN